MLKTQHTKIGLLVSLYDRICTMHPNIITLLKQQSFGKQFQAKVELGPQPFTTGTLPCWLVLADTLPLASGHGETRCGSETHQNRVWLQFGNLLTHV